MAKEYIIKRLRGEFSFIIKAPSLLLKENIFTVKLMYFLLEVTEMETNKNVISLILVIKTSVRVSKARLVSIA